VIEVKPDPFELVPYDAGEIAEIAQKVAAQIGLDADVVIEVDEELPTPLTGSTSDVVDGRGQIWISGGSLEDGRKPGHFSAERAEEELGLTLLRVQDRLGGEFDDAPVDDEVEDRQRAAWDVWAEGRLERLGVPVRKPRRRYGFRLYNGFTDVSDAAFQRLWGSSELSWADIDAMCADTLAADPRPREDGPRRFRKERLRPDPA
jgi:hypothetical protein